MVSQENQVAETIANQPVEILESRKTPIEPAI